MLADSEGIAHRSAMNRLAELQRQGRVTRRWVRLEHTTRGCYAYRPKAA